MPGTLRHVGMLVKDLDMAIEIYQQLGFVAVSRENLEVVKMRDKKGQTIELVKGNWNPHIAVDWYEDPDGNFVEIVHDDRHHSRDRDKS